MPGFMDYRSNVFNEVCNKISVCLQVCNSGYQLFLIHGPVKDQWGFVGTATLSTTYCTVQIMVKIKLLLARLNVFILN
jgi:hypothetical protein